MSDSDRTSPERTTAKTATAKGTKGQRVPAGLPHEHKPFELIPNWFKAALKNKRTWKTWIRVVLVLIANLIMMVANKSAHALGGASFFGIVCLGILPPMLPFSISVFAYFSMGFGMVLGWMWGVCAQASAHAARDKTRLNNQIQEVLANRGPNETPAVALRRATFEAKFLDPRSSAVFGVYIFIGGYALGTLRAKMPKLTLTTVTGTIIMCLNCAFGPLFPAPNYMLSKQLMIPGAVYYATALVSLILIFPQSLNYVTVKGLVNTQLRPIDKLIKMQDEALATSPGDVDAWHRLSLDTHTSRRDFVRANGGLEGQAKMLQLEVSRGRISAGQLAQLVSKTKDLATAAFGVGSFITVVDDMHKAQTRLRDKPLPHITSVVKENVQNAFNAVHAGSSPNGRSLNDLLPQVSEATADLRAASNKGLEDAMFWLNEINHHRFKKHPVDSPVITVRQENLQRLKDALADFLNNKHLALLGPFKPLFDEQTGRLKITDPKNVDKVALSLRSLFRCFIFTTTYVSYAKTLVDYLEFLLLIERTSPENKLQFPGPAKFADDLINTATDKDQNDTDGLNINSPLNDNGRDSTTDPTLDDGDDQDDVDEKRTKKKMRAPRQWAKDPDAGDPKTVFQRIGRYAVAGFNHIFSPSGVFALKYGLVSVVMWIPSVAPGSAKFYYDQRGLWALIMSSTGMGFIAGEQILNFLERGGGSVLGAILGMAAWYAGNGGGNGFRYGFVIATAFFASFPLLVRISGPPEGAGFWLMTGLTTVFTAGYSWDDAHNPNGNPGKGYEVSGKRALLVIIGFVGAFCMMMLPRPVSGKKLLRMGLSKNIQELGYLFGKQVTAFEQGRSDNAAGNQDEIKKGRVQSFRRLILRIFTRVLDIAQKIPMARIEPDLCGPWPRDLYRELMQTQADMLTASSVLSTAYSQISPEWCSTLTERSELLHPAFLADCMSLFAVLRHSLLAGTPLPPVLPIFERLAYYRSGVHARFAATQGKVDPTADNDPDGENNDIDPEDDDEPTLKTEAALANTFSHVLTWQNCYDDQLPIFATSLISIVQLVSGLNNMHEIVLELVGEAELDGFDRAQERWAKIELDV
ncbi:hypothetical protein Q8F55_004389 [Vanrija albida]|uniref:ER transporter 6TM N-terminal domain-containing protein n=1 Tax=Vanrija albida TaxID=181172 RepID=A0ABR3Q6M6_9TREE